MATGYTCVTRNTLRAVVHARPRLRFPGVDWYVEAIALAELAKLEATAARSDSDVTIARRELAQAERELAAYLDGVSAAGLEPGEYAQGARKRRDAVDGARARLEALLVRRPALVDGDPVSAWKRMDGGQRNRLQRSLVECVLVAPVGRGKRVPIGDRARVIKYGTGLVKAYPGGGAAMPVRRFVLPQPDDPVVLGV